MEIEFQPVFPIRLLKPKDCILYSILLNNPAESNSPILDPNPEKEEMRMAKKKRRKKKRRQVNLSLLNFSKCSDQELERGCQLFIYSY